MESSNCLENKGSIQSSPNHICHSLFPGVLLHCDSRVDFPYSHLRWSDRSLATTCDRRRPKVLQGSLQGDENGLRSRVGFPLLPWSWFGFRTRADPITMSPRSTTTCRSVCLGSYIDNPRRPRRAMLFVEDIARATICVLGENSAALAIDPKIRWRERISSQGTERPSTDWQLLRGGGTLLLWPQILKPDAIPLISGGTRTYRDVGTLWQR